jgi:HAD superfamily hydrolase (TIGR01509 family)
MIQEEFTPAAVIFDMDGLMLDTERVYRSAWARAMAEMGYALSDEFYLRIMGKTVTEIRSVFRTGFGPGVPIEAVINRKQQHVEAAFAERGIPIKAGLAGLLDRLDDWNLFKAVASSTARSMVVDMLSRSELAHRFEAIVGGDEVPRGKPAPDLFLAAAERLGVQAAGCVVLEDSEAGIRAACAAGMYPILIPDILAPSEEVRNLSRAVIPSLNEACGYLKQLGNFL